MFVCFIVASMDSTAQTGPNAVDWQEEAYQKVHCFSFKKRKKKKVQNFLDVSLVVEI